MVIASNKSRISRTLSDNSILQLVWLLEISMLHSLRSVSRMRSIFTIGIERLRGVSLTKFNVLLKMNPMNHKVKKKFIDHNYLTTMELLPEGQQNKVEVLFEDQMKINEFSKLISKKDTLSLELKRQKQEREYLDDVSLEIELVDEEELVNYKITENAFVKLPQAEVAEKLEGDGEKLDVVIEGLETKIGDIDERLTELKKALYLKFGDNINLER